MIRKEPRDCCWITYWTSEEIWSYRAFACEVRRDHDRGMVVNGCFHILCCYEGIESVCLVCCFSLRLDTICRGVVGRAVLPFMLAGIGGKVQGF